MKPLPEPLWYTVSFPHQIHSEKSGPHLHPAMLSHPGQPSENRKLPLELPETDGLDRIFHHEGVCEERDSAPPLPPIHKIHSVLCYVKT